MIENAREKILRAATELAQSRGYNGLNFRELAKTVGIKSPSVYHHFATKEDLGVAVARRYWEDTVKRLEILVASCADELHCLRKYPEIFRTTLENENRICLCSFMSAEFDGLPTAVRKEILKFSDVNVAWLTKLLITGKLTSKKKSEQQASAIFAAVAGAQLVARSRADLKLFDALIAGYRAAELIP